MPAEVAHQHDEEKRRADDHAEHFEQGDERGGDAEHHEYALPASPFGIQSASCSLELLKSIRAARQAMTTPSQNGRNAEPGPSWPHHL